MKRSDLAIHGNGMVSLMVGIADPRKKEIRPAGQPAGRQDHTYIKSSSARSERSHRLYAAWTTTPFCKLPISTALA